jgi:murein L,D-transpeptidase YafK
MRYLLPVAIVLVLLALLFPLLQNGLDQFKNATRHTVNSRQEKHGEAAKSRWATYFKAAGITYPPEHLVLVGLKEEKQLQVYAGKKGGAPVFIRQMPILAGSGVAGPKLQEGDRQVPEGLYRIESLNPNSRFHLSLRINYPNAFDRKQGKIDKRKDLGGDIMIHGNQVSIGCLAMGDEGAEDLFILAAETGVGAIDVVLAPFDFRTKPDKALPAEPAWVNQLYPAIRKALTDLPAPDAPEKQFHHAD